MDYNVEALKPVATKTTGKVTVGLRSVQLDKEDAVVCVECEKIIKH